MPMVYSNNNIWILTKVNRTTRRLFGHKTSFKLDPLSLIFPCIYMTFTGSTDIIHIISLINNLDRQCKLINLKNFTRKCKMMADNIPHPKSFFGHQKPKINPRQLILPNYPLHAELNSCSKATTKKFYCRSILWKHFSMPS